MAVSTVVLGWNAAIRIATAPNAANPVIPFGVRGGKIQLAAAENECGDSESGQFERHKPGRKKASVNLDFYEKADQDNLFQLNIGEGQFITLWVYEKGFLLPPYKFPQFLIYTYEAGWTEDGKMEGALTGKNDGVYYRPGE